MNDFVNWFWGFVDQILIELGLQVTSQNELVLGIGILIAAIITIGFLAWLSSHLFWPSPRYGGRSPEDVEDEDESGKVQVQELGVQELPPFEPSLRSRWKLYKNAEYEGAGGRFPNKEPVFFGAVAEVDRLEYLLFLGKGDSWLRFEGAEDLTDSARASLLDRLRKFWDESEKDINLETWKDVLPELRSYGIESGAEFYWGATTWKVDDFLGPYRVDVEGNTFAQGRELLSLLLLRVKEDDTEEQFSDDLYLLTVVEYTGGRTHMGGKMTLWSGGRETTPEEVSEWRDREVEISDHVRHAAKH